MTWRDSRVFEVAKRKGTIGEEICRRYLEKWGWVVYKAITEGPHAFDMLAIKDKHQVVAVEVKTKARLNKWPATGVDQKDFELYWRLSTQHNMPFWLFFVDEYEGLIYGNSLSELERPVVVGGHTYPMVLQLKRPIRIWHLSSMMTFGMLSEEEMAELKRYNQRAYGYAPVREDEPC